MRKIEMKSFSRSLSILMLIMLLNGACSSNQLPKVPSATLPEILEPEPQELSPANQDTVASLMGMSFEAFIEESYRRIVIRDPDTVIFMEGSYDKLKQGPFAGYGITNDQFTNISDAYVRETQQLQHAILDLLHTYDRSSLSYDLQVAYDIYEWYLVDLVEGHQFMYYNYPVSSVESWGMSQDSVIVFLMYEMEISTVEDAEDYISRLSEVDTWVDQVIENLQVRQQAGVLPTQFMLKGTLAQLDRGYSQDPNDLLDTPERNVLYTSFLDRLKKTDLISAEEKQVLSEQVLSEIKRSVIPAWHTLRTYMDSLREIAPEETGALDLPNGQAYYAYALRSATTSDMTPEQIYQLGLSEVERLQDEMRAFAHSELGYPANISMYELRLRLMRDAGPPESMKLLSTIQSLEQGMEDRTDAYFNIHPMRQILVKIAYPDTIYNDPPFNSSGPYIIRYDFNSALPRYELPSWWYHEIYPGHVFSQLLFYQLDLPAPTFHKTTLSAAYLEGWALYAEQLAWEMGLYENDPYGNLGRLEFKILRAARLVAEVGIHARGWSLEQVTSYLSSATGRPTPPSEALRYIIQPGQGCSYYVGYLKILELRQRAMDELGDKFDIRAFHDVLLKHGQMPLGVMERVVDDWIEVSLEP